MEFTSTLIGLEFFSEYEFLISEVSFHDFSIGFTLSFCIFGSSTLTRELHTHTIDTGSHVFDRCELDLELGLR